MKWTWCSSQAALLLLAVVCCLQVHVAQSDNYDFVEEVLEEERRHYGDDDYSDLHGQYADPYDDAERIREAQEREERLAREEADRIAAKREKEFQVELDKMNEEQKKAALRQRKKDTRLVKSILSAAEKKKHYRVLGIRNWNLSVPARTVRIASFQFRMPGFKVKETTTKDIRRAFRNRAMAVHPDKNRDKRAEEAFMQVEHSASILSDESARAQYDAQERIASQQLREAKMELALMVVSTLRRSFNKTLSAFYNILGPFATPILIIGALLA